MEDQKSVVLLMKMIVEVMDKLVKDVKPLQVEQQHLKHRICYERRRSELKSWKKELNNDVYEVAYFDDEKCEVNQECSNDSKCEGRFDKMDNCWLDDLEADIDWLLIVSKNDVVCRHSTDKDEQTVKDLEKACESWQKSVTEFRRIVACNKSGEKLK
ncbi:7038_t:CDS:2, partial [Dentiscutata erythropus]